MRDCARPGKGAGRDAEEKHLAESFLELMDDNPRFEKPSKTQEQSHSTQSHLDTWSETAARQGTSQRRTPSLPSCQQQQEEDGVVLSVWC